MLINHYQHVRNESKSYSAKRAQKVYQQSKILVRLFFEVIHSIVRLCNIRFPRQKRFTDHTYKSEFTSESNHRFVCSDQPRQQANFNLASNPTIRVDSIRIRNDFEENREKIEGTKGGGKGREER